MPPIKSQGIKTKLIPWIRSIIPRDFTGRWIEPFMGTGAVGFNVASHRAVLCDNNPHLINFYSGIASGEITPEIVKKYLIHEGEILLSKGFNRKGKFNIPFCRKPQRFAQAYITKITNQITWVSEVIKTKQFVFKCQDFKQTISESSSSDIIYCDPPYIDRHTDYYNTWNNSHEQELFNNLSNFEGKFIFSTWHHNDYRENDYIKTLWSKYQILTREHFYHVGGKEKNRNPVIEALAINFITTPTENKRENPEQLNQCTLFEI